MLRKKPSRPTKRNSSRRKPPSRSNWLATTAIAAIAMAALGGIGYTVISGADTLRADAHGCYQTGAPQGTTAIWLDASMIWSPSQERDIKQMISQAFQTTRFNERFSITTTEAAKVGDLAPPSLSLCGTAKSSADYAAHGIDKSASQAFLKAQSEKQFREKVAPVVNALFEETRATGEILAIDSPLLEQFQALSRRPDIRDAEGRRRLVLVSDGIQNTEIASFCQVKGHLPSFGKFMQRPGFQRVKPHSLSGADVSFYLVLQPALGPYCTEDELAGFWTAYFKEAGASSVDIYRLRPSGKG